jgi:hypothetical protein
MLTRVRERLASIIGTLKIFANIHKQNLHFFEDLILDALSLFMFLNLSQHY